MCEISSFLWHFFCATLRCHFCTPVAISIHRDSRTTYIHSLLRSHCQLVSLGVFNHHQTTLCWLQCQNELEQVECQQLIADWGRIGQHLKPQRKLPLGAMKHHVSNWLRHLQVCVLAMPRLGVWGTLWAARESSYWFSFAAFASWHAEHGEIEEPVWRGSVSTAVERKSKYQTTSKLII